MSEPIAGALARLATESGRAILALPDTVGAFTRRILAQSQGWLRRTADGGGKGTGTANQQVSVNPAVNYGSLGTAANEVYVGAVTHPVAGALPVDWAANFPNAGRVVIPWSAALNPSGPFTVECWANSASPSTDTANRTLVQSMIQGQNPANGNDRSGWNLREIGGDLQFLVGTTSGNPFYETDVYAVGVVSQGAWQHIAAVYDGAAVSLFVNGVLVTNKTLTLPLLANIAAPTIIGERGYGGWNFSGDIDEVAIYPSALSAATIKAHFDAATTAASPL